MFFARNLLRFLIPVTTGAVTPNCPPDVPLEACISRGEVTDHVIEQRSECDILVAVIHLLEELGEPATAFCSSYLHVPSVTTVPGPTVTPEPM